jgi:hypothetical protein
MSLTATWHENVGGSATHCTYIMDLQSGIELTGPGIAAQSHCQHAAI